MANGVALRQFGPAATPAREWSSSRRCRIPELGTEEDWVTTQRDKFTRHGYLKIRLLPGAASDDIESLCDELIASESRYVHVGDFGETWREYYIPRSGRIASLIAGRSLLGWVQAVAQEEVEPNPVIWGNLYRPGEHISWHRDKRGAVQLLMCLRQPPPECGGTFQVKRRGETLEIGLAPGDALLFRATKICHRITPLKAAGSVVDPIRMTAVARYFAPAPNA